MATLFRRSGNNYFLRDEADLALTPNLPAVTFLVNITPTGEYYLEQVDSYQMSGKLYGNVQARANRILETYQKRSASTGVLLGGTKGSGKSLLTKLVSVDASKLDMPTIVVNSPYRGDEFNKFIQDIHQQCIVLFDEFEKVYGSDEQTELLTLLDGLFPTKKLFIFTCNEMHRIDDNMINRPGRIFYNIRFTGLDEQFIREYCEDNLQNKQHIQTICNLAAMFDEFNFDSLKALVEEMNRYNETPQQALDMLNVKPVAYSVTYDVQISHKGEVVPEALMDLEYWTGSPLSGKFRASFYEKPDDDDDDDNGNVYHAPMCTPDNLVHANPAAGRYEYYLEKMDVRVTLTRRLENRPNMLAYL